MAYSCLERNTDLAVERQSVEHPEAANETSHSPSEPRPTPRTGPTAIRSPDLLVDNSDV